MTGDTRRAQAASDASPSDVEPLPDAWKRFEKAMDKVVKAPPQHRSTRPPKKRDAPAAARKDKE